MSGAGVDEYIRSLFSLIIPSGQQFKHREQLVVECFDIDLYWPCKNSTVGYVNTVNSYTVGNTDRARAA